MPSNESHSVHFDGCSLPLDHEGCCDVVTGSAAHIRVVRKPCVVFPARPGRAEEHVIHATVGRAERNAAMTAGYGAYFHLHEFTVPTLWGRFLKLVGRE